MTRISQALLFGLGSLSLTVALAACSQGQLSGGNGLTGTKAKDKDKQTEEPEDSDPGDQADESDEGTDVPVWVNASYLTCVPEKDQSTDTEVAMLCGLDDEDKQPVKPDGTKIEWVALNGSDEPTDDKNEDTGSEKRIERRFLFPGKLLAKRGVGVKFNGKDLAQGKKLAMTEAVKGLADDGALRSCLEADDAVASECVASDADADGSTPPSALKEVRIFVLSAINTGLLDGVAGANKKCEAGAQAGNLKGKFRAVISSDTQDAIDMVPTGLPIVDVKGVAVANNAADLFATTFNNPIVKSENGMVISDSGAWTGSNRDGRKSGKNCKNWTSNSPDYTGNAGRIGQTDEDWIFAQSLYGGAAPCVAVGHLYCVEYP